MDKEAIAIIGIGCRFPGAKNKEAFWHLLRDGIDAITEVPATRWDIESFYDPDPATPDKMNSRWGGFLRQVDQFDPHFFSISPREAASIDPQQRLLLEVSWEALEDAGRAVERLAGEPVGVFMGISSFDYDKLRFQNPVNLDAYTGTGTTNCIAANRISYTLDFTGPSIAIDTACSSSLVAVHLACQSLNNGESTYALAGGVSMLLSPWVTVSFAKAGFLAPDGRCKAFDSRANGYVRSEGAGVVVLKPLSQALESGDRIYAVLRGSAVNQDGRSNGLTAPNSLAQSEVIREAYQIAGVSPGRVQYIEAHGTGTKLGDPMEMNALGKVLSSDRPPGQYCAVGSVKTNIGHTEAAAGIAGLIKVALSLNYKQIPPSLHFQEPNPYIPFDKLPLKVQQTLEPWPEGVGTALAGVSSFGFGGTNAHVVLEEAPVQTRATNSVDRPRHILTLSAKTDKALLDLAQSYQAYFKSHPGAQLSDVCFTANTGRSHFDYRLAIATESISQLQASLDAFVTGRETLGLVKGIVNSRKRPKIVFLFTGQGSQYIDMGLSLYETQPIFRQTLNRCAEILRPYLEQPLLSALYGDSQNSKLDSTAYTQPALFALEYALYELWKSWGIEPAAVIGHSVGEYVAATVAGVFSLEDGLKLIAKRASLMQALPPEGTMVAVMADEKTVRAAIEPHTQRVSIAAVNGSESLVISGQRQAIEAVCTDLEAQGIKTKPLQVSHAFHSPLMEPMLAEFEQVAKLVTYNTPQIKLISNITGLFATSAVATPEYWCRHVLEPVRFAASMETLHRAGYDVFVEIGPKPILLGMGSQCLPEGATVWLPSLHPNRSDWQQMLESLAQLYVRGVPVDWLGFDRGYSRSKVALPTYPFQRQRYWIETDNNNQKPQGKSINGRSPLAPRSLIPPSPPCVGGEGAGGRAHVAAANNFHPLHGKMQRNPNAQSQDNSPCQSQPTTDDAEAAARLRTSNLIEWLRSYAETRINSRLIDERRCIPPYIVLDLGNRGILGMQVPHEYGGLGLNNYSTLKILEQLGAIDNTLAIFVGINNILGIRPILNYASKTVRDELLPILATGRELAAFAITEPGAGSNPQAISASAIPDANGTWRLHGTKIWSGSAAWAGVINVFVQQMDSSGHPAGISGFTIREGTRNLRQGPEALTMGMRGMVQNTVYLDGVPVGEQQVLGKLGAGMEVAQDSMMYGRLGIAAAAVGGMKRIAQLMLRYAERRSIATGRLLDNPVTLTRLSDLTAAITSVETLVARIAQLLDSRQPVPVEAYTACKTSAPEFLWQAADSLVQMLGGRGYIETNIAPQILRDARILRILEGPTETLNMFLGSRILNKNQELDKFLRGTLASPEVSERLHTAAGKIHERCQVGLPFPDRVSASRWAYGLTGEVATWAILLAAVQDAFKRSPSELLRQALTWCQLHFEQKIERALGGTPAESVLASANAIAEVITNYKSAIGDVEQTLPGEDWETDELLRRKRSITNPQPHSNILSVTDSASETRKPVVTSSNPPRAGVSPHTIESIQKWIETWLVKKLKIDAKSIDSKKVFSDYGIDSVMAVEFSQEMEEWLGGDLRLDPTIVWNFPNIEAVVLYLSSDLDLSMPGSRTPVGAEQPDNKKSDENSAIEEINETEIAELLDEEIALGKKRNKKRFER